MQQAPSSYEIRPADYEWAYLAMMDSPGGRGAFGALNRLERIEEKGFRWIPAILGFVVLAGIAATVASRFGATSLLALVAYAAAILLPGIWLLGAWLWDAISRKADRVFSRGDVSGMIRKIERGETPLPTGQVTLGWDDHAVSVEGGGRKVAVPWAERPLVRREGDRAVIMPYMRSGVPNIGQAVIVHSEAFADTPAFQQVVDDWTARASG